jgi:glutamate synthase (ferredoxin)
MVDLESLEDPGEIAGVRELIERHRDLTGSDLAEAVLADWPRSASRFVKVFPRDYRRMLEAIDRATESGLSGEEALEAAFEANAKDTARVSGN